MSLTLADMITLNDVSITDMGATDVFNDAPVLAALNPIEASHGTQHKFRKVTGAPVVGFRTIGNGRSNTASSSENITVDLAVLDATFDVEAALANNNPRGREWLVAREGQLSLAAALKAGEKQLFYGTDADSDGFEGMADSLDELADAMVLAAGVPAAGQNLTDIWMFRSTPDERFLNVCVGNEGRIDIGQSYEQMRPGANALDRNCIVTPMEGMMTLVTHSAKSVARLCNIDDSDSKVTDDKLSELFELFDESNPPTHVVMNKRSGRQLRNSRVATTVDGRHVPLPKDWDGIDIIYTSSIGYYPEANKIV